VPYSSAGPCSDLLPIAAAGSAGVQKVELSASAPGEVVMGLSMKAACRRIEVAPEAEEEGMPCEVRLLAGDAGEIWRLSSSADQLELSQFGMLSSEMRVTPLGSYLGTSVLMLQPFP